MEYYYGKMAAEGWDEKRVRQSLRESEEYRNKK